MKKLFFVIVLTLLAVSASVPQAEATNGDNLIGIGPIARSMGGVGIAAPQDAISAVFANPAAMCFGPYCPGAEFNFAGTLFMPDVSANVSNAAFGVNTGADSDDKVYAIPAIGLSVPITNAFPLWRFGLAAYGVSGLGVDYRNTSLDQTLSTPFGPAPLVAGAYTQLQIMKFAPSIAYQPNEKFSAGLAIHIDYGALDLGSGSSSNYGLGVQLGVLYKITDSVRVGATYTTPQSIKYNNVADFDNDGSFDTLKLEQPQEVGLGIAFEPIRDTFLIEINGKWINWANANGYDDFDWKDQWVFSIGAQYKPMKELALRIGYNYTNNPVEEHSNFNGLNPVTVQGKTMPAYYYETFRIIGFPAIVKQHITVGIGYEFSKKFAVNAGYTHAFKETITENGTFGPAPVSLQSNLSEDSLEFGFTWRF